MGYKTNNVADITEPKRVSLSALPNFIQIQSKPGAKTYRELNIAIGDFVNYLSSVLRFTEPSGVVHEFRGTIVPEEVGGSTFFISMYKENTAENLRQALLSDKWVNANFEIRIPFTWSDDAAHGGSILNIKSYGAGTEFNAVVTAPYNEDNHAYIITEIAPVSINNDSISGEAATTEISLDVYTDPPIFLGADDRPTTPESIGNFAVTLSKTYSGAPIWFDVNAPFAKSAGANTPPDAPGWFDTGTMRVFRFIARVVGINGFSFYVSNALYVLRGFAELSDPINMEDYVYTSEKIKLLTNKPRTIYVRGQIEYLNFILSDRTHGEVGAPDWNVYILYRAYDTLGNFIGDGQSDTISHKTLGMVNTCKLRIDDVLTNFPAAGIVKVSLARNGAIISNDLEYTIRPAALHTLKQFSFINKLGGWDSFNFDAAPTEDTKVSFDTFTKTVTPAYHKGAGVETVYGSQLDNTLTVVGAPVTDDVAEWLKELAASTLVLDSDGRYVIKTEFTLPAGEGSTNMQVPTMKYKLSETYTNE